MRGEDWVARGRVEEEVGGNVGPPKHYKRGQKDQFDILFWWKILCIILAMQEYMS